MVFVFIDHLLFGGRMSFVPSLSTVLSVQQERTYLDLAAYSQAIDQIARTEDPQQRDYLAVMLFLRHWRNWKPGPVSLIESSFQRYGWSALTPSLWGFTEDSFAHRKAELLYHVEQRIALFAQRGGFLALLAKRQEQLRYLAQKHDLEASLFS